MRSCLTRARVCGLAAVTVGTFAIALHSPALVADGFSESLVAGLAGVVDLEPVPAIDDVEIGVAPAAAAPGRAKSFARQSVPALDRAAAYRDGELFKNSKVALPLLVADLEPKVAARVRPMSGRSVGARPAAAWTKSVTVAPGDAVQADSSKRGSTAWASFGQR